jgi:S-adenosylmethionine hydrolase
MKGMILMRFPAARIVDLTHETLVHWPAEAGFWIARAYRYFPSGTLHVAVVDPGVGTQRDIIVLEHDRHAFLAPDNGLLGTLASAPGARAYRVDAARLQRFAIVEPSAPFHGRDIFAPLAPSLAAGRTRPAIGPAPPHRAPMAGIEVAGQRVIGVVTLDHFGNHHQHRRRPAGPLPARDCPCRRARAAAQAHLWRRAAGASGAVNSFSACSRSPARSKALPKRPRARTRRADHGD